MERIRSRVAHALGGAVRVQGGGLIALAAVVLAGGGCTGHRSLRMQDVLPAGWVPSTPATQLIAAFNPQVQHLPDPSKDGVMGAGIVGQFYLVAADGNYTDANGDLYVMAEDITPRPPGHPPAVTEIWHFDPPALRKLRSKDERFGDNYSLFLPYPPNWKDVTQLRITTQYKPKGDPEKEPTLPGAPQTLLLDFTPPGEQASVWLDKSGEKPTAPVEIKGMPNVARDIAQGGLTAPLTGPQPNGTVIAGGNPPPSGGVIPTAGQTFSQQPMQPAFNPFTAPQSNAVVPPPSTPQLPPPIQFTPDRPNVTVRGPNGETLNVTAMALPPGQSVPPGWVKQPDGSIQPPNVAAAGITPQSSQFQQSWPAQAGYTATTPPNYQPASASFVPASQQYQPRIQHGAFNQPQQQQQQLPASLPPLPASVMPPSNPAFPPVGTMPGQVPAMPTQPNTVGGPMMPVIQPPATPAGGGAVAPPNFDPNSPVGGWALQPPPTGVSNSPSTSTVTISRGR